MRRAALTGGGCARSRKRRIPAVVSATSARQSLDGRVRRGEGFVESQAQGSIGFATVETQSRATDSAVDQDPEVGAGRQITHRVMWRTARRRGGTSGGDVVRLLTRGTLRRVWRQRGVVARKYAVHGWSIPQNLSLLRWDPRALVGRGHALRCEPEEAVSTRQWTARRTKPGEPHDRLRNATSPRAGAQSKPL